jgi:general secretion pathway protein E
LSRLNDIERKIYTVESIPGYHLSGVTQTYLRPDRGVTISAVVQNLLEQDPDVLFLDDIDDCQAAECAVRAAEQGVFVIATLAAPSVFDALWRLARLAPPPARAGRCIRGVLAQHLVRRICPECRAEDTGDNALLHGYLPSLRRDLSPGARLVRGAGCDACRQTGYRGRIGVFDVLTPSEEMGDLLSQGASPRVLRENAIGAARVSFRDDLAGKLAEGVTSADEAWRTLLAFDEV